MSSYHTINLLTFHFSVHIVVKFKFDKVDEVGLSRQPLIPRPGGAGQVGPPGCPAPHPDSAGLRREVRQFLCWFKQGGQRHGHPHR